MALVRWRDHALEQRVERDRLARGRAEVERLGAGQHPLELRAGDAVDLLGRQPGLQRAAERP
jgi:hypothetical protein